MSGRRSSRTQPPSRRCSCSPRKPRGTRRRSRHTGPTPPSRPEEGGTSGQRTAPTWTESGRRLGKCSPGGSSGAGRDVSCKGTGRDKSENWHLYSPPPSARQQHFQSADGGPSALCAEVTRINPWPLWVQLRKDSRPKIWEAGASQCRIMSWVG